MKLLLKKLYPLIFMSLLTTSNNVVAQKTAKQSSAFSTSEPDIEKRKEIYTKTFDSMFLEKQYKEIIEVGERLAMDREPEIKKFPTPYLVAAYYFSGNTDKSNKLLDKWISKMDYKEMVHLFTTSNLAMIRYFEASPNRENLVFLALEKYRKKEKATQKLEGTRIIRFFIVDQRIRKLKSSYANDTGAHKEAVDNTMRMEDSVQNIGVYKFYKKNGKYFNSDEVGEFVSWLQPIILSHYDNIELRQTFFKDLLEKAVQEGRMEKTNYVHFLLRTESFTDPNFFKNLEKRMEEVRKEYDLPDYLWNPF